MEHTEMETMDNDEFDMDMGMAQNDDNDQQQSARHLLGETDDEDADGDFKEHYECKSSSLIYF